MSIESEQKQKAQEIKRFFSGLAEGLKASMWDKGLEYAERIFAVQRGEPLKPGDDNPVYLARMKQKDFPTMMRGMSWERYEESVKQYRLPPAEQVIGRDGNIDRQKVWEYRMAIAAAPIKETRDYSNQEVTASVSGGRIVLSADTKWGYDPYRLTIAYAGGKEDLKTITIPYSHLGPTGEITGKTKIILNKESAKNLLPAIREALEAEGKIDRK